MPSFSLGEDAAEFRQTPPHLRKCAMGYECPRDIEVCEDCGVGPEVA